MPQTCLSRCGSWNTKKLHLSRTRAPVHGPDFAPTGSPDEKHLPTESRVQFKRFWTREDFGSPLQGKWATSVPREETPVSM